MENGDGMDLVIRHDGTGRIVVTIRFGMGTYNVVFQLRDVLGELMNGIFDQGPLLLGI